MTLSDIFTDDNSRGHLENLSEARQTVLLEQYNLPAGGRLETMLDPYVSGTVAVRIFYPDAGDGTDDYLFIRGCDEPDEVTFTQWPPVAGPMQFY